MYGTGIGTGVSGAVMIGGLTIGSWLLVAVAALALVVMFITLTRGAFRRGADQRP